MNAKQVYLLESSIGTVKIGCSRNPQARADLVSAHSACPVRLVAIIPGDHRAEHEFHVRFAAYRSHSEWFRNEGPVLDFFQQVFGKGLGDVPEWPDVTTTKRDSAAFRKRLSDAAKQRWADPVFRARLVLYRQNRERIEAHLKSREAA